MQAFMFAEMVRRFCVVVREVSKLGTKRVTRVKSVSCHVQRKMLARARKAMGIFKMPVAMSMEFFQDYQVLSTVPISSSQYSRSSFVLFRIELSFVAIRKCCSVGTARIVHLDAS